MANALKKVTGVASIAGTTIYTVPVSTTLTLIGCRAANKDSINYHTFHIEINGVLVSGIDTPLPVGSAMDIMVGSKLTLEAGDTIIAYSDADLVVDIYVSYLEQT